MGHANRKDMKMPLLSVHPHMDFGFLDWLVALTLNRLRQEASIDADIGACDEAAGLFAGEENGGAHQLFGPAKAAHRRVIEDGLCACGRGAIRLKEQRTILFGRKESWRD